MEFKVIDGNVQDNSPAEDIDEHEIFPVNVEMTNTLIHALKGNDKAMLMPYIYDGPKYSGDNVNGAELWDRFSNKPSYYLMHHEIELINKFSKNINEDIGKGVTYIELGPGSKYSLVNKTIPLIREGNNVNGYVAVDVSRYHIEQSIRVIRDSFPSIKYRGYEQDFSASNIRSFHDKKPVAFLLGSTACNIPESMHNDIPSKTMQFFSNIRKFIGPEGYFIVTQDVNQDRVDLFNAYDTTECEDFCMNVLQRVKRDCDIQVFDEQGFGFKTIWHEKQQFIGGYAVARYNQFSRIGGQYLPIHKGDKINLYRSYKYSVDDFKRMGEMAGFKPMSIYMHHKGNIALHVWKA